MHRSLQKVKAPIAKSMKAAFRSKDQALTGRAARTPKQAHTGLWSLGKRSALVSTAEKTIRDPSPTHMNRVD